MAITRSAHSRALHSETLVSKSRTARKLARSSSNRTQKHPGLQSRGRQNSQNQIRRPEQAHYDEGQTDPGLSSVLQSESGPSGVRFRPVLSPTLPESASSADRNALTQPMEEEQDHISPTATAAAGTKSSPIDLGDVGLPFDDLWDYERAIDEKICPSHGETEYLLVPSVKPLRPSGFHSTEVNHELEASLEAEGDFEVLFQQAQAKLRALCKETEAGLDALFQELKDHPQEFQPYSQSGQVGCMDDLRSRVHVVFDRDCRGEENVYTVQLKAEWIPGSLDPRPWLGQEILAKGAGEKEWAITFVAQSWSTQRRIMQKSERLSITEVS